MAHGTFRMFENKNAHVSLNATGFALIFFIAFCVYVPVTPIVMIFVGCDIVKFKKVYG